VLTALLFRRHRHALGRTPTAAAPTGTAGRPVVAH
jgi:hypothetical protein